MVWSNKIFNSQFKKVWNALNCLCIRSKCQLKLGALKFSYWPIEWTAIGCQQELCIFILLLVHGCRRENWNSGLWPGHFSGSFRGQPRSCFGVFMSFNSARHCQLSNTTGNVFCKLITTFEATKTTHLEQIIVK